MHVAEDLVRTREDAERIGQEMDAARWAGWEHENYDEWTDADPDARLELDWTLQTVNRLIAGDRDTSDHAVHSQLGFSLFDGSLIPFDEDAAGILVQSVDQVKSAADFLEAFVEDGTLDRHAASSRADRDQLRAGRAALRRTLEFYVRARDRRTAVIKFCSMG